jgi:hypothetical protein
MFTLEEKQAGVRWHYAKGAFAATWTSQNRLTYNFSHGAFPRFYMNQGTASMSSESTAINQ